MLLRVHRAGTTAAAVVDRGCAGLLYAFVEAPAERIRAIPGRCVRDGTGCCDHEEEGERKKVQAHALLVLILNKIIPL